VYWTYKRAFFGRRAAFSPRPSGLRRIKNGGVNFARRRLTAASLVFWPFLILLKQNLALIMSTDPKLPTVWMTVFSARLFAHEKIALLIIGA
jgi:hypothetical protein